MDKPDNDKPVERDEEGNLYNTGNADDQLWHSNPYCTHKIIYPTGGGIKCVKCGGWCCY